MDPLNNPTPTPTPTPEPTPAPTPTPTPAPVPTSEPSLTTTPVPEPALTTPEPVSTPGSTSIPEPTPVSVPNNPEPVNPIINPTNSSPVPPFQPGIAATDPIMTPEPVNKIDPVEEELKTPMQAAAPVPGSIGSAISGPASNTIDEQAIVGGGSFGERAGSDRVKSTSFDNMTTDAGMVSGNLVKPKSNKTLIMLIIIAGIIIVALAIILIMQLVGSGNNQSNSSANSNSSNSSSNSNSSNSNNGSSNNSDSETVLSCVRNLTPEELVLHNGAISGTIDISAEFSGTYLDYITLVRTMNHDTEGDPETEPVETEVYKAAAEDMTTQEADVYYLPTIEDGVVLDINDIRDNYERLDFTCDLL